MEIPFYLPIKDLQPYVKKAQDYGKSINLELQFMEIPFCLFGEINSSIKNLCGPPHLGKQQPPKEYRSKIEDIPSYRLKKKLDMCNGCKAFSVCDGFFINDINKFGTGSLKPLL